MAQPTAADLRAMLARHELPIYLVGAAARIHPVRFGRLLSGRLTLTPELITRIVEAIDRLARERAP